MVKLQKPAYAFMNEKIIPWDEAVLHVGCEAVNRGLNVFEGVKGYWQENGRFGIVELEKHYKRLLRSAKLLYIPCPWTYDDYKKGIFQLMGALLTREKDMWSRTSLFVTEGHWGEGTKSDLVITSYHQDKHKPEPINLGVSSWQRSLDISLPARIKTSTNYQVARMAKIEGRSRNCQDMVLLNHMGRVAETTTSAIAIVRDGVIYTPPATEGALESITLDIVEKIANSMGIPFVRRPIDRTELIIADEITICGSLSELVPIQSIDNVEMDAYGTIFTALRERFFEIARGKVESSDITFEFIPEEYLQQIS
jgi:branched-chain amino acid aminotransferase